MTFLIFVIWAYPLGTLLRDVDSSQPPQDAGLAMTVRDKLPILPVPLKSPNPDVRLDLGKALDDAFAQGEY